ncbi:YdcF family protein [Rhodococcoides yunnanense]|uniref:YdcF family protein n=1 Tax=Rhodococcoides yunnanense TaxID=278209 RepID=A0ABU4B6W3_9NOCA|nr:YdcF family protein [Rhodococcus yunnanensis]MDV6259899.1 YdcF family protein [Rhodococcus yunnanensis]
MFRGRLLLLLAFAIPVVLVSLVGVGGYVAFTKARVDPLTTADAIVVLGGEHDGREAYGISLAQQGLAKTVVLSDPYGAGDPTMKKYCGASTSQFEVLCIPPLPSTTRGEAMFTEDLARERGWNHVIVVTWRYHLPRARYIFDQCFDGTVTMRPTPRAYDFSLVEWEFTYLYQIAGFVKAGVQGSCENSASD